jgi:hypothetical protein
LYHSGGIYEPAQTAPIHIGFPATVRGVTLESTGALKCTGTYGRMLGYRDGTQVTQADNVLANPSDCGWDDVTYGVQGALQVDVDIDSLVIEGVDPWTFEVEGAPNGGRALLQYMIRYQPTPPGVTCDTVTRAQVATCRITGSVDTVYGWQFRGEFEPGQGGQNDSVYVNRMSQQSTASWSGTAVLSGVVFAIVSTDGIPDTLSGSLAAIPRAWTGRLVQGTHADSGQGQLPVRPDSLHDLGAAGLSLLIRQDVEAYYDVVDDGGPNQGLGYLTDVPFRTETYTSVNYAALQVGSDFYLIQESRDRRIKGVLYCGRDRVPAIVPDVEAHEGTDPANQPNSHVGIYLAHVQDVAGPRVESLVAQGFNLDLTETRSGIQAEAFADSKAMDNDDRNTFELPCVFWYDYSRLQ